MVKSRPISRKLEQRASIIVVPPSTCSIRRLYCIESSFSTRANEPRVRGSHIYVSYWTLCERSERGDNKLDNFTCRYTTYRHRFTRAAPAPRAKRNDVMMKRKIQRIVDVHRPSITSPNQVLSHAAASQPLQVCAGKRGP